ncbi:MAG: S-layer homology domain-containing protein [Actinomycetota bacterium]|nr:S-layer homology domain-containing protein [Actinomycetota bacterium]
MRIQIDLSRPRWLPRLTTRRRKALAALAAVGLVAGPTAVWATDTFVDVPTNDAAHEDIDKIYNAGVARGCGPDADNTYCPDNPVTRRQMAQFLSRTGGVAEYVSNEAPGAPFNMTPGQRAVLLTLSGFLTPGRLGGGQQLVKVDAHVSVRADSTARCPCTATLFLQEDVPGTDKVSADHLVTIAQPVGGIGGDASTVAVSASMVVPEPSGVERNFLLVGELTTVTDGTVPTQLRAIGDMTATSYPFDG